MALKAVPNTPPLQVMFERPFLHMHYFEQNISIYEYLEQFPLRFLEDINVDF